MTAQNMIALHDTQKTQPEAGVYVIARVGNAGWQKLYYDGENYGYVDRAGSLSIVRGVVEYGNLPK